MKGEIGRAGGTNGPKQSRVTIREREEQMNSKSRPF